MALDAQVRQRAVAVTAAAHVGAPVPEPFVTAEVPDVFPVALAPLRPGHHHADGSVAAASPSASSSRSVGSPKPRDKKAGGGKTKAAGGKGKKKEGKKAKAAASSRTRRRGGGKSSGDTDDNDDDDDAAGAAAAAAAGSLDSDDVGPDDGCESEEEAATLSAKQRKKLVDALEFNALAYNEADLVALCFDMFEVLGLVEPDGRAPAPIDDDADLDTVPVRVEAAKLKGFLGEAARGYRHVPYHNFQHATNVVQCVVHVLHACGARDHFAPLEVLSLLVASIGHDFDHPGVNNNFLVNDAAPIALLYNDRHVLEQHHTSGTFRVLRRPGADILSHLGKKAFARARKCIVDAIMATDLAVHGEHLGALKAITADLDDAAAAAGAAAAGATANDDGSGGGGAAGPEKPAWASDEARRRTVLACIIKAADIGNEIRPAAVGEQWAMCVVTEFFAQTALELERGLPTLPHMDPKTTTLAKAQIGFIKFLCAPLFAELTRIYPAFQPASQQMQQNLARWEQLAQEQDEAAEAGAATDDAPAEDAGGDGDKKDTSSSSSDKKKARRSSSKKSASTSSVKKTSSSSSSGKKSSTASPSTRKTSRRDSSSSTSRRSKSSAAGTDKKAKKGSRR